MTLTAALAMSFTYAGVANAETRSLVERLRMRGKQTLKIENERLCRWTADANGMKKGGFRYAFAGDYETKGCYYYPSGKFANIVFWGKGGSYADNHHTDTKMFKSGKRRFSPNCHHAGYKTGGGRYP